MTGKIEWRRFPSTCVKCEEQGEYFDGFYERAEWVDDWHSNSKSNVHDFKWQVNCFPKRCKECHAKSESYRKANNTLKKLENIRELLEVNDMTRYHNDGWKYLKFVTLTWKNEWTPGYGELTSKDLAAARLSLRRKRDKIADKLHVAGGTDVMENVRTTIWKLPDEFPFGVQEPYTRNHLHSHGVWIMPYHPIETISKVMVKYVGRDQCRAIRPKRFWSYRHEKWIEIPALSRARKYLMKYLTKEKGLKRGNWGLARGTFCEAKFCEFLYSESDVKVTTS